MLIDLEYGYDQYTAMIRYKYYIKWKKKFLFIVKGSKWIGLVWVWGKKKFKPIKFNLIDLIFFKIFFFNKLELNQLNKNWVDAVCVTVLK